MSQTVTKLQHGATMSRPYDAAYDPVYKVSNASTKYVPIHARQAALASTQKSVGATIQSKSAVSAGSVGESVHTNVGSDSRVIVGAERHKYFKRPVVAYMDAIPSNIIVPKEDIAEEATEEVVVETASKTVGMQTVYRESEAQTDPYTADYIVSPDQPEPEVLSQAHLTFGNGQPGALEEVEYVKRLRERKAYEASIPKGTDEKSLRIRAKMLEAQELKDWEERDKLICQEQLQKLDALQAMLEAREEHVDLLNEARIDKVRENATMKRDIAFSNIHDERLKNFRSIEHSYEPNSKGQKRDIIDETYDAGSKLYARDTRSGSVPFQNQVVDYGIPLLNNFQGLVALQGALPRADMQHPVAQVHTPSVEELQPQGRVNQKYRSELEYVHDVLAKAHNPKKKEKTVNIYKRFEPVTRPATPQVEKPQDVEVSRAVLQIQRLLRGRAVQLAMMKSKARSSALIHELSLSIENDNLAHQEEELQAKNEADAAAEALDAISGTIINEALDFFTKEVVRVAEERKVLEFVAKAKESRRARETAESGRRQVEYMLRKKREHAFELINTVHSDTATSLIDSIFNTTIEQMATEAGEKFMQEQILANNNRPEKHKVEVDPEDEPEFIFKQVVVDPVTGRTLETSREDFLENERVVRELLRDILLPEVDRQREKRQVDVEDRKFVSAAHDAVIEIVADLGRHILHEDRHTHSVPITRTGEEK